MTLETPELKAVKVRVSIEMKPIEFVDEYVKMPTNEEILEGLALQIREGTQDEKFIIRIIEVEE